MSYQSLHFYEETEEADHNKRDYVCEVSASGTLFTLEGDYESPSEELVLHQELSVVKAFYLDEDREMVWANPKELIDLESCFDTEALLLSTVN